MKSTKKVLDINAHITNVQCTIGVNDDTSKATLSFDNSGYGVITAIKFNAKGYNSFGDIVPISGKEQFFLIVQDIHIEKNEHAENLKIQLPNSDIRKLDLQECQICYADGSVSTYVGPDIREFDVAEFDSYGPEGETLEALRDVVSPDIHNLPIDLDYGWICACGQYNRHDFSACCKCGLEKSNVFQINDPVYISTIKEKHQQRIEEHRELDRIALKEKEAADKKRHLQIAIGVIVATFIIIILSYAVVMSGRTTYSSEDEMRTALQGTYTYYDDSGKIKRYLVIKNNTATLVYPSINETLDSDVKEWEYKKGRFHTFEDWIVTNTGDLKNGDDVYKKGGRISSASKSTSTTVAESGSSALKITVDRVTSNSSYSICTGSVKNTGKKTYKYVEVKGAFKDSQGNVVDTDWTYAVGSEGLEPGESSTFRLSVPKQYKISSCTVTLKDYS